MARKNKSRNRRNYPSGSPVRIKGNGILPINTLTDAGGLFVLASYDIDTDLFLSWTELGTCFEQWRVRSLRFKFVTNDASNTLGTIYMACTDDPDESSPVNEYEIMSMRTAIAAHQFKDTTLRWKPKNQWMYTQDQLTSDDRWEMPGVFLFGTSGYSTAHSVGHIQVIYDVEFRFVANQAVIARTKTSVPLPLTEKGVNVKGDDDAQLEKLGKSKPVGEAPTSRREKKRLLLEELKALL